MVAPNALDLTGRQFGFLTALRRAGQKRRARPNSGPALWECQCQCGSTAIVRSDRLVQGRTRSCGCNKYNRIAQRPKRLTTCIECAPLEYKTWLRMHRRCYRKRDHRYKWYGKRGIVVCERWHVFENFLSDMGPKPDSFSVERKDVNGNYEPTNCVWGTDRQQRRNTQRSFYVKFEGTRQLLIDICEKLGLNRNVVYQRLKLGWKLKRALTEPVHKRKSGTK